MRKVTIKNGTIVTDEEIAQEEGAKCPVITSEEYLIISSRKVADQQKREDRDLIWITRVSNRYFSQLVIAEFSAVFFAYFGLALSIFKYEIQQRREEEEFSLNLALFINTTCTLFLIFSLYVRYEIWLVWCKSVETFIENDTLITTGLWRTLVFEGIICLIAPYPFFEDKYLEEYVVDFKTDARLRINDLLLFGMFARIYLLVRFIFYVSEFLNPRT
mmetsp:Transcript_1371/g.1802  ORF Transcript_1371/g.1802 Transcript_1371/m.1802 type:complete len:217 (+) Transcript_1371:480-1130(+)